VKDTGLLLALGLVGMIVLSLLLVPGGTEEDRPAPEFTLANLAGEDVSLDSLYGSVVILDFWASWCSPCTKTYPALHELVEQYAAQGVVLVTVSIDKSEEAAREYMMENGFPFDLVLWGSLEEARAVKAVYGVGGIPHTFVIDREGTIRFSGNPTSIDASVVEEVLAL